MIEHILAAIGGCFLVWLISYVVRWLWKHRNEKGYQSPGGSY